MDNLQNHNFSSIYERAEVAGQTSKERQMLPKRKEDTEALICLRRAQQEDRTVTQWVKRFQPVFLMNW